MTYDIPPKPHQYVPPPKRPIRSDADRVRFGKLVIACGAVFFAGSFAYVMSSGTMTGPQALVATLPLAMIFVALGAAIWKQGADGIGPMVAYIGAVVAACSMLAAWLWG